jgi:hypothetical protein
MSVTFCGPFSRALRNKKIHDYLCKMVLQHTLPLIPLISSNSVSFCELNRVIKNRLCTICFHIFFFFLHTHILDGDTRFKVIISSSGHNTHIQGVPKRYIHKVNIPYYNVYTPFWDTLYTCFVEYVIAMYVEYVCVRRRIYKKQIVQRRFLITLFH